MNNLHEEACESMDAYVFTSDILFNKKSLEEFKNYVARWNRAIEEHETNYPQIISLAVYAQTEDSEYKDYTSVPCKVGDIDCTLNIRVHETFDLNSGMNEARSCEMCLNTFEKEL